MRVRVEFSKTGPLIYIGNLDLQTLWERAIRRAGLPLAYSQAFHPQPKIHFAAPLPLGFSSRCEVLDMRLTEDVAVDTLPDRLNSALPGGIRVLAAEVSGETDPALQTRVVSADYEVVLGEAFKLEDLEPALGRLLASDSIPRQRRTRRYDLRPLIEEAWLEQGAADGAVRIHMRLTAKEGATGRPDEVLEALGIPREEAHVERTALNFRPLLVELKLAPEVR